MTPRLSAATLREWAQSARYFAHTGKDKTLSRPAQALLAERLLTVTLELMRVRGILPSDGDHA
jgi:hypothetical protein